MVSLTVAVASACSNAVTECKPCAGNVVVDLSGLIDAEAWTRTTQVQFCVDGACQARMSIIHSVPDSRSENLHLAESKTATHSLEVRTFTQEGPAHTVSGSGLIIPPLERHGCECDAWRIVYDPQRQALVRAV